MSYVRPIAVVGAVVISLIASDVRSATVELAPRWKAGDAWDLEVTKSVEHKQGEQVLKSGRWTAHVTVTVKEVRAKGYLLEWRIGEVQASADTEVTPELSHARTLLAHKCPLLVEVDPTGNPTRLNNAGDVRRSLEKGIDALTPPAATPQERTAFLAMMRKAYRTDESLKNLLTKDLGLLTAPFGAAYRQGTPITYETKLASPHGNYLVPATGSFQLTRQDESAGTATIESKMMTDRRKTAAAVRQAVREAVGAGGLPPSQETMRELTSMIIEDRGEYVVDTARGWPVKVRHRRVVRNGEQQKLDGVWVTSTPRSAGEAGAR